MKKKNISKILLFVLSLVLCVMLVGCTTQEKTPSDLIKENFSGQEFNISFNSESLDKPVEDMTYSINAIPKLPVPQKVGYIFEGWFFDKEFVMPYTDDSLKLAMHDVTLYPKWSKEVFEHNGTYAIEFDAQIVEGTVKKGKTTDVYGGYDDLSKLIIKDACQIEKSDDKLLLKIQYDAGALTPFQTGGTVFSISINEKMGTDIYIKDKIDSLASQIKTIFIKIDKWDLSTTLYLDVMWINYHDERGVNEINRYGTTTTYEVAIDLTKIIGFEESFANPDIPLEEGYYLAKSYFRKENNEESMGAAFNPVYSYLYSDGHSNYKLIKQNIPYFGLVSSVGPLLNPIINNFYDRLTCFVSFVMAFDIDNAYKREVVDSDYYAEIYNGGYYRRSVTEFHADTGKFYNIIDIDSDLTKEYIALTAVSGFMEVADGMGYIRQVLSIDYDNLVKLPECDFKPLNGDFYEYESDFNFYPGGIKDLNKHNLLEDAINNFGMSIEMPNFYYEAHAQDMPLDKKNILSFSMEVTPTKETSAIRLADSRGRIGEFNVNHKVYGYDVRNGKNLYLDRMNPQAFSDIGYNNQLRDVTQIKTGKDTKVGETVDLEQLFRDKVNDNLDFIYVGYSAYEINNGKIDFDKKVNVSRQFEFSRDIAIEFTYNDGNQNSKTIVELKDIPAPQFSVKDDYNWSEGEDYRFTKTFATNVGKTVKYPELSYVWGEASYDFIQNFYNDEEGKESINPARTMHITHSGGRHILKLSSRFSTTFTIDASNMSIVYEVLNEYRERHNVYFDYINKPRDAYIIADTNGEQLAKNDVPYKKREDGVIVRVPIDLSATMSIVHDKFNVDHIRNYTHTEDDFTSNYTFVGYSVFSNNGKLENQSPDTPSVMVDNINNFLADKDFGAVYFYYTHGEDKLVTKYLYKMTFSGSKDFNLMTEKTYFSNTEYIIDKNFLVGSNMEKISNMNLSVKRLIDGRVSPNWSDHDTCRPHDEGMQYSLKFMYPGTYLVEFRYEIKNDVLNIDDNWSTGYGFSTIINVKSNLGDVKVTYKTDSKHPFKGGDLEKTVIYNLGEGITTLGINGFDSFTGANKPDGLYQWVNTEGTYSLGFGPNSIILGKDFIEKFGCDEVVLTAKWEHKFTVECEASGEIIKVSAYIEYNKYCIVLPNVRGALIPDNHVFIGWTGGMLGSKIYTGKVYLAYRTDYDTPSSFPEDYFKIKAVFRKVHKIHFEIDTSIADPIKSTTAIEGFKIDEAKEKLQVQITDKTYRFVGYKVKGTSKVLTKQEFIDYICTGETTFVAVFEKVGVTP